MPRYRYVEASGCILPACGACLGIHAIGNVLVTRWTQLRSRQPAKTWGQVHHALPRPRTAGLSIGLAGEFGGCRNLCLNSRARCGNPVRFGFLRDDLPWEWLEIPRFLITGVGADIGRIRRIRKSLRSRGIAEILRFDGVRRGVPERAMGGEHRVVSGGRLYSGGCRVRRVDMLGWRLKGFGGNGDCRPIRESERLPAYEA